jgi:hypothetical protein
MSATHAKRWFAIAVITLVMVYCMVLLLATVGLLADRGGLTKFNQGFLVGLGCWAIPKALGWCVDQLPGSDAKPRPASDAPGIAA